MDERIIRPGVLKRAAELLKCRGRRYTQEDVENVMSAFWDVVIDAVREGDSVNLNGYLSVGTKHMAERRARNVAEDREITVPEHYRVCLKAGTKLNRAAMEFTERRLGGKENG